MGRTDEGRTDREVRDTVTRLQSEDAITVRDYNEIRRADQERIRKELDSYESEKDRQKREYAEANRRARGELG